MPGTGVNKLSQEIAQELVATATQILSPGKGIL